MARPVIAFKSKGKSSNHFYFYSLSKTPGSKESFTEPRALNVYLCVEYLYVFYACVWLWVWVLKTKIQKIKTKSNEFALQKAGKGRTGSGGGAWYRPVIYILFLNFFAYLSLNGYTACHSCRAEGTWVEIWTLRENEKLTWKFLVCLSGGVCSSLGSSHRSIRSTKTIFICIFILFNFLF